MSNLNKLQACLRKISDVKVSESSEDLYEIRFYTPAGEDFSFSIYGKTWTELIKSAWEVFFDFEPDKHVEQWVVARTTREDGSIPSVEILVEDAAEIKDTLNTIAIALNNFKVER